MPRRNPNNLHTVEEVRDAMGALVATWQERARDARERGALNSAVIYTTALNELINLADRVRPPRAPVKAFITGPERPPPLPRVEFVNPADAWPLDVDARPPVKLWQLVHDRKQSRVMMEFHRLVAADELVEFTCDACKHAPGCRLAFDPYNTNGDCLAEK